MRAHRYRSLGEHGWCPGNGNQLILPGCPCGGWQPKTVHMVRWPLLPAGIAVMRPSLSHAGNERSAQRNTRLRDAALPH